jgi:hypothetical protein
MAEKLPSIAINMKVETMTEAAPLAAAFTDLVASISEEEISSHAYNVADASSLTKKFASMKFRFMILREISLFLA